MQSIVGYSDDDHSNDEHTSPHIKPRSKDSLLHRPVSTPTLKPPQAPTNEPRDRQDADPLPEPKARGKSKSRIDPGMIRRANSKPAPEEPKKADSPRFQDLSLGPNSPVPNRTEDVALRPPPIPGLENFGIPPPSEDPVDAELSAKLAKFLALKKQGTHFNDILMRNKSFNNPHIYTKLVEFVEVDETGTNFPKEVWDPTDVQPEWYADELAAAQKKKSAESAAAQGAGKRSRIAFSAGSTSGVHPSTLEKNREERGRHDDRSRSEGSKRRHEDGGRFHPYQPKADMGWMPRSHSSSGRSRW